MENLTKLSWEAGDTVSILADSLHHRIEDEIDQLLRKQLKILGFKFDDTTSSCASFHNYQGIEGFKRRLYPDDPDTLCVYEYNGKDILAVMVGPNSMSIVFDVPELET